MTSASERRLAAILAADLVGYSRLMEADEKGTHERLRTLRKELIEPPIAAHHGQVVKLTGDGALVEFPSVVGAVECAVEVQSAVAERNQGLPEQQQLWFRNGINIGDIILKDGDIYGDGVNVAARLEGLAEPGGICVAPQRLQPGQEQAGVRLRADGRDVELNRFLDGHPGSGLPLCATEEQLAKYPDMKHLEQCEAERASG